MGSVESHRLARQRGLFLTLSGAMVCHREAQARGGADGILVAESGGITVASQLCGFLPEGFGVHPGLCVRLDSLYPKPDHPLSPRRGASGLPQVWESVSAALAFLSGVRQPGGGNSD